MKKDGGPAFPMLYEGLPGEKCTHGMSLRDYFAVQALAGLVSNAAHVHTPASAAARCYELADAMLAEREK